MGVTLTDVLLFGKAQSDDVNNATLVIYRRNILRWSALGGYLDIIVHGTSPISLPDAIANSLAYLKAFGGTEQRNLPAEYTQLEYIESTGTQYIDTGVVPKTTLSIKIKYNILQLASSNNIAIFGSISSQTGLFSGVAGSPSVYYINTGATSLSDIPFAFNTIREEEYINDTMIRDGVTYTTDPIIENNISMTLFGRNTGSEIARIGTLRIYYFTLYDNGVLIQNLIPAKRNSDNVLGMYDTVSGTFLTNAGTGTFTAGPTAVPTPDTPMDIVSNNGVLKANRNLYSTEYHDKTLSQSDGITTGTNVGVNVSAMVDCTNVKSFMVTSADPKGSYRLFKYRPDGTFIDAQTTSVSIGQVLTLPSDCGYFRIQYNYSVGTGTEDILIYNSAHNLGIYTDGTVETINVHGKNLFDSTMTATGFVLDDFGQANSDPNSSVSDYIKVKPNTQYTLSLVRTQNQIYTRIITYSADKTFIALKVKDTNTNAGARTYTFTTNSNAEYIRFCFKTDSTDIQLELGSTATDYTPYFDGGTATAEMLLKVGDYQDVQSILDGVVTRNVGVLVLDGTEDWDYQSQVPSVMTIKSVVFPADFYSNPNNNVGYCNYYTVVATSTSLSSVLTSGQMGWNTIGNIMFKWTESGASGVASFKQFLAAQYANGTPVIVVYPLATPTTESVAGQTLQVQQGDNVVEITQAAIDGLEIEAKYQAAVSLTIQEVQDANLDPNVQVTIN